jgi:hypothetical protein
LSNSAATFSGDVDEVGAEHCPRVVLAQVVYMISHIFEFIGQIVVEVVLVVIVGLLPAGTLLPHLLLHNRSHFLLNITPQHSLHPIGLMVVRDQNHRLLGHLGREVVKMSVQSGTRKIGRRI